MTAKSLKEEDKLPFNVVLDAIDKKMDDVLRVVDAMNLGRTEVKADGIYRSFNNGTVIKIASGDFKKHRLKTKRVKLF